MIPQVVWASFHDPVDPGGKTRVPQDVGRSTFEQVRRAGRLGLARRIAAGSPLPPGTDLVSVRGPTNRAPVPVGP